MTRDLTIRRRSALSALGVIGLSSAGAGLGTTAFFSDEEAYENNELVAGELDLKIDWEEHYYRGDIVDDLDIVFSDPGSGYRPFPAGSTEETRGVHGVWVNEEDVPAFMAQTALEAYPDDDGDGLVEFPDSRIACEVLGDLDGALSEYTDGDPTTEQTGRTDNEDTRLSDGSAAPLVNLEDVKPGDFGEITFSTHLCDNDGYLWINAPDGFQEANNTTTEPEGEDVDDTGADLAETVRTALWYDNNCNNLPDTTVEPLDLMIAVDTSGTIDESRMEDVQRALNEFVDELPADDTVQMGLMEFSGYQESSDNLDPITVLADLGDVGRFTGNGDHAPPGDLLPEQGDGNTAMPGAVDLSAKILNGGGRSDTRSAIILVTDGQPNYAAQVGDSDGVQYSVTHDGTDYTSQVFYDGVDPTRPTEDEREEMAEVANSVAPEIYTISISDQRESELNEFLQTRVASESENAYLTEFGPDLPETTEQIVQDLTVRDGEEYIFRGLTLAEAMDYLTGNDGRGIPLDGDRLNGAFDELDDPENASERQCFDASATSCFGFSWWVPVDHGNEIQSDSVTFDLGFYTEQCRRNDGAGLPPEVEES